VRCTAAGLSPVALDLPEIERAGRLARETLERHPFLGARRYRFPREAAEVRIRLEVVCSDGPGSRDYELGRVAAEVLYDPYVLDRSAEVELVLHLRCYLGASPEPRPAGPVPPAEELLRRPFDGAGLRRTLWHEYGHLLDAARPEFGYDVGLKRGLEAYERAILNELWNAFIDRRLSKLAPEEDRPHFRPLPVHSRPALEDALRRVWAGDREWTYPDLVRAAGEAGAAGRLACLPQNRSARPAESGDARDGQNGEGQVSP
jgi:hypothetical protein